MLFSVERTICWSKEAIKDGLKWCAGDGKSMNVFSDSWISEVPLEREVWTTTRASEDEVLRVDQFITADKEWDAGKLMVVFSEDIVQKVLSIPLPKGAAHDQVMWQGDRINKFSVSEAYRLCARREDNSRR